MFIVHLAATSNREKETKENKNKALRRTRQKKSENV